MPGDFCTTTANCFGVLVCSASVVVTASMNKQSRECGCSIGDNQRWDGSLARCIGPKIGDRCDRDSECTAKKLLPASAQTRICRSGRCGCQDQHFAYKGHCYALSNETCAKCPEDSRNDPCRKTYLMLSDDEKNDENCLTERAIELEKQERETKQLTCVRFIAIYS